MRYTRHVATMLLYITLHTKTVYGMDHNHLLVALRAGLKAQPTHDIEMVDLAPKILNATQNADTSDEPAENTPEPTERS